jgi:hypothetical protein
MDQNFFHKEIKSRFSLVNSCHHSIQTISSSCLLSKNIKIKICRGITFPVLAGCETSCFTLKEAHRFRVFENRVLKRLFGSKRVEVT